MLFLDFEGKKEWLGLDSRLCVFFKILFLIMHLCVEMCTHECRFPWRLEEGVRSPRAGVAGGCERLTWVLGPKLGSSV